MSAASTTPARVFPQLLSLSQRHVSKLRKAGSPGAYVDRLIQEVMNHIGSEGFPATLSLEEQGVFFIGYYHQRTDLYTKKTPDSSASDDISAD
jgi:CRISPR-associated protein Csd1